MSRVRTNLVSIINMAENTAWTDYTRRRLRYLYQREFLTSYTEKGSRELFLSIVKFIEEELELPVTTRRLDGCLGSITWRKGRKWEDGAEFIELSSTLNYYGLCKVALHEIGHWYSLTCWEEYFSERPPGYYTEQMAEAMGYSAGVELGIDTRMFSATYIAGKMEGASRKILNINNAVLATEAMVDFIKYYMEGK